MISKPLCVCRSGLLYFPMTWFIMALTVFRVYLFTNSASIVILHVSIPSVCVCESRGGVFHMTWFIMALTVFRVYLFTNSASIVILHLLIPGVCGCECRVVYFHYFPQKRSYYGIICVPCLTVQNQCFFCGSLCIQVSVSASVGATRG